MNFTKTMLLLAALTALLMGFGALIGGTGGALIALVVAIGINGFAYWNSGSMALRAHRAKQVDAQTAPELYRMVEEMAVGAGLPMPGVYVIEQPQPNAFATGRNPENASVAVTTGLVERLNDEELAGVIAHELAHIKNRDTLIMTVAATVAGAVSMLANFGMFFGGGRDRGAAAFIGVLIAAILAPMAAMLIQMMISRTREYSADRLGGEICGNPMWLASALGRIANRRGLEMESAERNPASAHLFIVNPLSGHRFDNLFTTHPKTENRIAALEAQATEMSRMGDLGGFDDSDADRRWGMPETRR